MLKRLSPRELLENLASQWEPVIRQAWISAIDDIRSNIVLRRIVERLEKGDVSGAIAALNLDEAAFRPLDRAVLDAFEGGGQATVEQMPALRDPDGNRIVLRFDVRNPAAEQWLRQHSSDLITGIVQDTRNGVREVLESGLAEGVNPRTTALNITGRLNRATGKRDGSLIGLSRNQMQYVENARRQLASGDPAQLRAYLDRARRDKRFDRAITKAIKDGKPLDKATVDRIVGRYSDRLLQLRGEVIARSETMTSLNRSQIAAYEQAIASGAVDERAVTKRWVATKDGRTRDTHRHLDGKTVGIRENFTTFWGAPIAYPGDPAAPASERVACRCTMMIRIDHMRGLT